MRRKIIVFAPHPDDEILGCGGTIAKKVREDCEVTIVVMTDGRNALSTVFGINSTPTPEELKPLRKEETIRAAAILGVQKEKVLFFDFVDGELLQHRKDAEEKVANILEEELPAEIYFPYERDYHIDHRTTNNIILNSASVVNSSALRFRYSITQKYSRLGPLLDRLLNIFKHNLFAVDIVEFLPLKKAAIKEFKSQVTIMSVSQKRPILTEINRFLNSKEVFYVK